MTYYVNVPVLYGVTLDEQTKDILNRQDNKSQYIRNALMYAANKEGFELPEYNDLRPKYISAYTWNLVIDQNNKSRNVDYTYVVAYYFLLGLFPYLGKSEIIKHAILEYSQA